MNRSYQSGTSLHFTLLSPGEHIGIFKHIFHRLIILILRSSPLFGVILMAMQITGCVDLKVTAGNYPNIDALDTKLIIGKSTEQDVIKAMGEPNGKGGMLFPIMDSSKDSWTYYYEKGDLKDARRLFLFVLFVDHRYDGYMWFSSLPEFKPELGH